MFAGSNQINIGRKMCCFCINAFFCHFLLCFCNNNNNNKKSWLLRKLSGRSWKLYLTKECQQSFGSNNHIGVTHPVLIPTKHRPRNFKNRFALCSQLPPQTHKIHARLCVSVSSDRSQLFPAPTSVEPRDREQKQSLYLFSFMLFLTVNSFKYYSKNIIIIII